jgi:hypothetical protein
METTRLKPREQGDLGELSAMEWLASKGARLYIPVFHSPDVDLVAELEGQTLRIEVKTCVHRREHGRWGVLISTRGGNQSWTGLVKYFEPGRCDYLFVHVGDGRRWFIPTAALDCRSGLTLGGPKYSQFEIEPGTALDARARPLESSVPGEYRSGQPGGAVNAVAQSFAGSNPASPIRRSDRAALNPSKRERSLGRSGQAVINQKRRVTIPQSAFFPAGFQPGDRLRARSDRPGRVILELMELPDWARAR